MHNNYILCCTIKGAASVKEVVVTKRRLREVVLQWTIDEDLSQDLLQLHSSQDVVMLNANTITLAVSAEKSSVTIIAVYRLNGTNVTWSSEPVAVTLQPFGKSFYVLFMHEKINIFFFIHSP